MFPYQVLAYTFTNAGNDSGTFVSQNQRIHAMAFDESTDIRPADGYCFDFYDQMPLLDGRSGDILIGDNPFVFQYCRFHIASSFYLTAQRMFVGNCGQMPEIFL